LEKLMQTVNRDFEWDFAASPSQDRVSGQEKQ
jgi:hypothetical protein